MTLSLESFRSLSTDTKFHKPIVPILYPSIEKIVIDKGVFDSSYLARHYRESVNIAEAHGVRTSLKYYSKKLSSSQ